MVWYSAGRHYRNQLYHPPTGMNVFVPKRVLKEYISEDDLQGRRTFWVTDIFRIFLIALVPGIALFLRSMM